MAWKIFNKKCCSTLLDIYKSENWALPIIDLPVVKTFSRRREVDFKCVCLVEPTFENPYGLAYFEVLNDIVSSLYKYSFHLSLETDMYSYSKLVQ